jgi:hypothetical protein
VTRTIEQFYKINPSLHQNWRAINLFGRNTATYKFALSKSLLDLARKDKSSVTIYELSPIFAHHVCEHLRNQEKQITSNKSQFIEACKQFNTGDITEAHLHDVTSRLAFTNVIDRFHTVGGDTIPTKFYEDERSSNKRLVLTDNLFEIISSESGNDLYLETEARWRLVETAWSLDLSRTIISADDNLDYLYADKIRRANLTSSRSALNGYQKGRCFYCFSNISLTSSSSKFCDVDHFFPFVLKRNALLNSVDGIWNLVLSCQTCNRGVQGKFDRVPDLSLVGRLHQRNEYYVVSHHPLRETIISQTGKSESERRATIQNAYNIALSSLIHSWKPIKQSESSF